jgi:hypothetical protein
MRGNTCEFVVGRLLEVRVAAGYRNANDVHEMMAMVGNAVARIGPGEKFTVVADWRAVQVMAPETAALARTMLTGVNPRVTRSAILTLPEQPTTNLQVVRLIREAENPDRRLFSSPFELRDWLSEVLTPAETARLRVFLDLPS